MTKAVPPSVHPGGETGMSPSWGRCCARAGHGGSRRGPSSAKSHGPGAAGEAAVPALLRVGSRSCTLP